MDAVDECDLGLVEGCECPGDLVWYNGQCTQLYECPCYDEDGNERVILIYLLMISIISLLV